MILFAYSEKSKKGGGDIKTQFDIGAILGGLLGSAGKF